MATSNFAARTREHTLQSGNVVEVREHLSFLAIASRLEREDDGLGDMFAEWTSGKRLDGNQAKAALRLHDVLVQEFVVTPKVMVPDVDPPGDDADYGTGWCWINDLTDQELTELVDMASTGVSQAAGFPGGTEGDDDRPDGEVLGDDPKPAPRPRKRKR